MQFSILIKFYDRCLQVKFADVDIVTNGAIWGLTPANWVCFMAQMLYGQCNVFETKRRKFTVLLCPKILYLKDLLEHRRYFVRRQFANKNSNFTRQQAFQIFPSRRVHSPRV